MRKNHIWKIKGKKHSTTLSAIFAKNLVILLLNAQRKINLEISAQTPSLINQGSLVALSVDKKDILLQTAPIKTMELKQLTTKIVTIIKSQLLVFRVAKKDTFQQNAPKNSTKIKTSHLLKDRKKCALLVVLKADILEDQIVQK